MKILPLLFAFLSAPAAFAAAPVPAEPFGDEMVLQREAKVPVFGKADPGGKVTVAFAGQTKETVADKDGAWRVELDPMPASADNRVMTLACGPDKAEIKNVLVGEVWICSGQSNMEFTVAKSLMAKAAAHTADPGLRLRSIAKITAGAPQNAVKGTPWLRADAQSIAAFSAVGYAFGGRLRTDLKVPVGLVNASWGGTRIEAWTPAGAQPQVPSPASGAAQQKPAVLYNGMIHPWAGYAIRGAIWYQGEANCFQGDGAKYTDRMQAMVSGWRQAFGRGDFAFYFVQLAPFNYGGDKKRKVAADALPVFWAAQARAAAEIKNAGMAHTQDVGNWGNIHPADKLPVGERLARLALSRTYGKASFKDDAGPVFKAMTVNGGEAKITFDHAQSGLAARDGKPPAGFEVAGADGRFVDAAAKIDGAAVVVSSPQVAEIARVRFGWQTGQDTNLFNGEKLPACAFSAKAP